MLTFDFNKIERDRIMFENMKRVTEQQDIQMSLI